VAIHNPKDFYSGLMFLAMGLAFAIGATNYPRDEGYDIWAGLGKAGVSSALGGYGNRRDLPTAIEAGSSGGVLRQARAFGGRLSLIHPAIQG
jgi:hypothetical protein